LLLGVVRSESGNAVRPDYALFVVSAPTKGSAPSTGGEYCPPRACVLLNSNRTTSLSVTISTTRGPHPRSDEGNGRFHVCGPRWVAFPKMAFIWWRGSREHAERRRFYVGICWVSASGHPEHRELRCRGADTAPRHSSAHPPLDSLHHALICGNQVQTSWVHAALPATNVPLALWPTTMR